MRMSPFSLSIVVRGYRAMFDKCGVIDEAVYRQATGFDTFYAIPVLMNRSLLESLEALLEVEMPLIAMAVKVKDNELATEDHYDEIDRLAEKRKDCYLLYETMRTMLALNIDDLIVVPIEVPARPAGLKQRAPVETEAQC